MSQDLFKSKEEAMFEMVIMAMAEAMNKKFPVVTSENILLAADAMVGVAFTYGLQCAATDPENPTFEEIKKVKDALVNMIQSAEPVRRMGRVM